MKQYGHIETDLKNYHRAHCPLKLPAPCLPERTDTTFNTHAGACKNDQVIHRINFKRQISSLDKSE